MFYSLPVYSGGEAKTRRNSKNNSPRNSRHCAIRSPSASALATSSCVWIYCIYQTRDREERWCLATCLKESWGRFLIPTQALTCSEAPGKIVLLPCLQSEDVNVFSCWPVRLPWPDSSLKMLLSSKNFCGDDDKNLAIWTGDGVWGSSCRCREYWRLLFARQLHTVSLVSLPLLAWVSVEK